MPLALLPLPPNATNFIFSVRNQIEKWGVYEFGWEKNTPLISSYGNRDRWRERGTSPTFFLFFISLLQITRKRSTHSKKFITHSKMPIILFLRYIIQNTSQPIQELDHGRKYLYVEILSRSYNEHTA